MYGRSWVRTSTSLIITCSLGPRPKTCQREAVGLGVDESGV